MILLDTDHLTVLLRPGEPRHKALVERLDASGESIDAIGVSIVSVEEQIRGWMAFIARARRTSDQVAGYARLTKLLDETASLPIVGFDELVAAEFERLKRIRVRVGTQDLKIAATAITHDATPLSSNLKDFRQVPGIKLDNWI